MWRNRVDSNSYEAESEGREEGGEWYPVQIHRLIDALSNMVDKARKPSGARQHAEETNRT